MYLQFSGVCLAGKKQNRKGVKGCAGTYILEINRKFTRQNFGAVKRVHNFLHTDVQGISISTGNAYGIVPSGANS